MCLAQLYFISCVTLFSESFILETQVFLVIRNYFECIYFTIFSTVSSFLCSWNPYYIDVESSGGDSLFFLYFVPYSLSYPPFLFCIFAVLFGRCLQLIFKSFFQLFISPITFLISKSSFVFSNYSFNSIVFLLYGYNISPLLSEDISGRVFGGFFRGFYLPEQSVSPSCLFPYSFALLIHF